LFSSDSPIFSLEPIEPVAFSASQLQGLTAAHLTCLMNLTFIGDEKRGSNPLFPRPPSPAKIIADVDSRRKSIELDSEGLEKQLDEDMARALLAEDVPSDDHNADKKVGTGTQTDISDGTVTQTSSVTGAKQSNTTSSVLTDLKDVEDRESSVTTTSDSAAGWYSLIDLNLPQFR